MQSITDDQAELNKLTSKWSAWKTIKPHTEIIGTQIRGHKVITKIKREIKPVMSALFCLICGEAIQVFNSHRVEVPAGRYLKHLPSDFIIHQESGELVEKERSIVMTRMKKGRVCQSCCDSNNNIKHLFEEVDG